MRWFVEISPLGASKGQKQKWCLEAPGWQPALKDARALRGEDGPLGGFSIELLDDGARAVDPASRIRYVIRSAPDDAQLTHTKDGPIPGVATKSEPPKSEPAASSAKPSAPASTPDAAPAKAESAKPAAPASTPAASPKAESVQPAAPAASPKAESIKPAAPASAPATVPASAPATVPASAPSSAPATEADGSDDVDIPVDDEGDESDESEAPAQLPEYQLLRAREEEPSERSPLTYREHVYAVAESTSDEDIERLLLARFETLKQSITGGKAGRFVNIAIFDHVFTSKPSRKPRATLAWKDWRGEPEIQVGGAGRPSAGPPSFAAPTSLSVPVPQPSVRHAEAAPATAAPSTVMADTELAPPPAASSDSSPIGLRTTEPAPAPATPKPATPAPESPAKAAPSTPAPAENARANDTAATLEPQRPTQPAAEPARPVVVKVEAAPPVKVESAPPPAKPSAPATTPPRTPPPVSAAPKTMPAAAPARREAFIPKVKTRAEAGKRVAGDELISELFEACGDLHFLRDSLEGADFILALALEKLPSEVGLLSLFDINRREFVVVRQAGGPRSIVLARLPERAGLAQVAMRKQSAVVVPNAEKEPRALDDRVRTLGLSLTSLMIAPVEQSGRYLGLIELWNPIDGRPFTEGDGHALTYIGQQYAEFVAERGVLLDPDLVLERHQKR